MSGLPLHEIRRIAGEEPNKILFSDHADIEMRRRNMNRGVIFQVLSNGIINKKENDEYTDGRLTKFTLTWRTFTVTVKNSSIPFIISVSPPD